MITVTVKGTEALIKDLRAAQVDVQDDARAVLKEQSAAIRSDAQGRCPVDKGILKRSVRATVAKKKLEATVSAGGKVGANDAYYAQFVEFGTKKAKAQPFLFPAARAHDEETQEKLTAVMYNAIKKGAGG